MTDTIVFNLRDQLISSAKSGDLKSFKSAMESELFPFINFNPDFDSYTELAAFYNKQEIVDYLLRKVGFGGIIGNAQYALCGFCKGGHQGAFMELLDRIIPLLKEGNNSLHLMPVLQVCISSGKIDMARMVLGLVTKKPYSEVCSLKNEYSSDDKPYRRLLSYCLKYGNTELIDELFEKCAILKDEIDFDEILSVAKALNAVDFIKLLEGWKEKYPYQHKPKFSNGNNQLVIGNLSSPIGFGLSQLVR